MMSLKKLISLDKNVFLQKGICTLKNTADGLVPKARLVARGFEEKGLQEIPNDSPSCL